MPSLVPGYEYDVFISYRQNDNRSGWVTEFVRALEEELAAAIKDPVSIYFDVNPHDGLLETHNVDKSLEGKLKCLIFIPVLSQTYCDPKSFAWQHEFCAFNKLALQDQFGRDIKVGNGNVASRILPIRIHNLEGTDKNIIQNEIGGPLRSLDFIYRSAGVNRPLRSNEENPEENLNHTIYRNQINKVANATKEIIYRLRGVDGSESPDDPTVDEKKISHATSTQKSSTYPQSFQASHHAPRSGHSTSLLIAVVVFFTVLTGFIAWNLRPKPTTAEVAITRTSISLPEQNPVMFVGDATLAIGRTSLAISPDGRRIVYVGMSGKTTKLFQRNIGEDNIVEIPNTNGAYNPVFSPSGNHIAFFQKNNLRKIRLDGSEPVLIAQAPNMFDVTWSDNNELYYSTHEGARLFVAKEKVEEVTFDSTGFTSFRNLQVIPGTRSLLYSGRTKIGIYDLEKRTATTLPITGSDAQYTPTGHLVYVRGSSLMAVRFNLSRLELTSEPVEVLSGFRIDDSKGQYHFSTNGTLAFVRGDNTQIAEFVFHSASNGKVESLNIPSQQYQQFDLSPDGNRLAAPEFHNDWNINIHDLRNGKTTHLTSEGSCSYPVWHPDGSRVFYTIGTDSYYKDPDKEVNSGFFMKSSRVWSFSNDGKLVAIGRPGGSIYVRGIQDSTLNYIARGGFAAISPDGKFVTYTGYESGETQVYLQPYPTTGQKWQVSQDDGSEEPRWSKDGKTIFFRAGQKWMSVAVANTSRLQLGSPKQVIEGDYINTPGYSYDLAPGEEKFLLVKGVSDSKSNQINIVQGWFEELHRLPTISK